jgi:hypothetical protein
MESRASSKNDRYKCKDLQPEPNKLELYSVTAARLEVDAILELVQITRTVITIGRKLAYSTALHYHSVALNFQQVVEDQVDSRSNGTS